MPTFGEIQFFPVAGSVSPPSPDPHDGAGLNQYQPQSKLCVLYILLCFTNVWNSYFMPRIVLGAKDKKISSKADSYLLFDRQDSMPDVNLLFLIPRPNLLCFVDL